jgi:hypothetical protein
MEDPRILRNPALKKRERHCRERGTPLMSPSVRIGLMIGPERGRYHDKVARLGADAEAAEQAGFTSIWVPQIPDDFDALTAVALMGQATTRIEIATAVMPIQTRHPIAMAQQALSTQEVCEGRFTLGLGPSHHWIVTDMLGLPSDRPAARAQLPGSAQRRACGRARSTSRTTTTACTTRSTSPTRPCRCFSPRLLP